MRLRAIFACREPDRDADPFAQLPVNLERLVWAAQKQFECGERLDTAVLDPRVVLEGVPRAYVCASGLVGGAWREQQTVARSYRSSGRGGRRRDTVFVTLVPVTLAARKVVFGIA